MNGSTASIVAPVALATYDETALDKNTLESDSADQQCLCSECGSYCGSYVTRNKFCNGSAETENICETCLQKRWQDEVNELIKYKTNLETDVCELRQYLCILSIIFND